MGYKGIKLEHKKFGPGVVIKEKDGFLTIRFDSGKVSQFMNDADILLKHFDFIMPEDVEHLKVRKSISKNTNTLNYAFKCNYCNGGCSDTTVGFNGPCSDDVIKYNIEVAKRAWCSNENSSCRKYYDGKITREELDKGVFDTEEFCCYEATVFKNWEFKAGYDNAKNPPKPRRMPGVRAGGLCFITTCFPGSKERYIVGAYIADLVSEGGKDSEGYMKCTTDLHVELSPSECKQLKFWDYFKNPNSVNSKQWGTGLYRKPSKDEALAIIDKIIEIKTGTKDQDVAERMKAEFCKKNKI